MEGRYMRIMLTPLPPGQGKVAPKPEKKETARTTEQKNNGKPKETPTVSVEKPAE
jgi:hypothetical protein